MWGKSTVVAGLAGFATVYLRYLVTGLSEFTADMQTNMENFHVAPYEI